MRKLKHTISPLAVTALLFFTAFLTIHLPAVHTDRFGATVVYNGRSMIEKVIYEETVLPEKRQYDGNGNPAELTDTEGKETIYGYDGENRENYMDFAGEETTKKYDSVSGQWNMTG